MGGLEGLDLLVDRLGRVATDGQVLAVALDAAGARVLPAYYSDNYVSLLPGERRVVTIRTEVGAARADRIAVRGWNVAPDEIRIGDAR